MRWHVTLALLLSAAYASTPSVGAPRDALDNFIGAWEPVLKANAVCITSHICLTNARYSSGIRPFLEDLVKEQPEYAGKISFNSISTSVMTEAEEYWVLRTLLSRGPFVQPMRITFKVSEYDKTLTRTEESPILRYPLAGSGALPESFKYTLPASDFSLSNAGEAEDKAFVVMEVTEFPDMLFVQIIRPNQDDPVKLNEVETFNGISYILVALVKGDHRGAYSSTWLSMVEKDRYVWRRSDCDDSYAEIDLEDMSLATWVVYVQSSKLALIFYGNAPICQSSGTGKSSLVRALAEVFQNSLGYSGMEEFRRANVDTETETDEQTDSDTEEEADSGSSQNDEESEGEFIARQRPTENNERPMDSETRPVLGRDTKEKSEEPKPAVPPSKDPILLLRLVFRPNGQYYALLLILFSNSVLAGALTAVLYWHSARGDLQI